MKINGWVWLRLGLTGGTMAFWVGLIHQPVWAQTPVNDGVTTTESAAFTDVTANASFSLADVNQPATTVDEWSAQLEAAVVSITGVRVEATETGIEVVLETAAGELAAPTSRTVGNALIADIPNATLDLAEGEFFEAFGPAEGIVLVSVTETTDGGVQVSITGTDAPPSAEFTADPTGLVLSVVPSQEGLTQSEADTIQITVTGDQGDGYYVPRATTGTRIEAPLRDLPLSIQVIPQQVIEDRGTVRLSELNDLVSGVQTFLGYGGLSSNNVYIRGFEQDVNLRNGFRGQGFRNPRDVANIERVEFLRGPASIIYGALEPGGVVNTITERPLPEPTYTVGMTAGSYSFYRPTLDVSGPLTEDQSLLYRLNIAYENAGSYRDFVENESFFIAPVLSWQISPRTNLTVEFEYQNYSYIFDRGFRAEPEFLELPRNRFLGEPDFSFNETNSYFASYRLEHEFSDNWQFRQGFAALINDQPLLREVNILPLEDDRRTLPRAATRTSERAESFALQNDFIGEFQTGSIGHQVVLGLDLNRDVRNFTFFRTPLAPIDIFEPVYGAVPSGFTPNFANNIATNSVGLYAQDLIRVMPNLNILAGLRFDWSDILVEDLFTGETENDFTESALSPRIGIVYQPTDSTSIYANWARSFNPQVFGRSRTNEPFEAERGEQFEVGVRQEFFDSRLAATLALFDITKQNVLTTDPVDESFSVQTGRQRSRGIEFDLVGEPLPGWNVIANYAYIDAFVSEDNDIPEGERLPGIPRNSASLWTTYEIRQGNLQGLGFGVGVVFVGDRQVRLPNALEIPSYVRADASVSYRQDNWRAALNFKNLFNTNYYETQGFFIYPQAPFTVLGSVQVTF
jgi:iron complex outermembrane receptor protein